MGSRSSPVNSRKDITRSGRPRDEGRRDDLRRRAAGVLLDRGVATLTLAELARALGESPRMLVHHFGSRDALVEAALGEARRALLDAYERHLAAHPVSDLGSAVATMRDFVEAEGNRAHFRLFGEVGAIAAHDPARFEGFARASVHDWLPAMRAALEASGIAESESGGMATLALAVIRGLLLDVRATGEEGRVAAAYAALATRPVARAAPAGGVSASRAPPGSIVRRADPETDAEACAAIYAPFVTGGAVSFEEEAPDAAEIGSRMRAARAWLVAEHEGSVAGFAYATAHRPRPAYRWAVETSVYVAPAAQGRGLGRALYGALLDDLGARGFRTALAVIALPNAASVALHEAAGFEPVGVLRAIGYKAGAWRDVGWWQRSLACAPAAPGPPPEPRM